MHSCIMYFTKKQVIKSQFCNLHVLCVLHIKKMRKNTSTWLKAGLEHIFNKVWVYPGLFLVRFNIRNFLIDLDMKNLINGPEKDMFSVHILAKYRIHD